MSGFIKKGAATRVRNGVGGTLLLTSEKIIFQGHEFNIGNKYCEAYLSEIDTMFKNGLNQISIVLTNGNSESFRVFGRDEWLRAIESAKQNCTLQPSSDIENGNDESDNKETYKNTDELSNNDNYINDNNVKFKNNDLSKGEIFIAIFSILIFIIFIYWILSVVFNDPFINKNKLSNSSWTTLNGYEMVIKNGNCSITLYSSAITGLSCKYVHNPQKTNKNFIYLCLYNYCESKEVYGSEDELSIDGVVFYKSKSQ